MNYLVVAEFCFLDVPGGAHRVAWDIAKLMRDRGHAVTLFCYRNSDQTTDGIAELEGIRVVRFSKTELPGWDPRRLHAIIDSAATACTRWLADRRFDVVHVHTPLVGLGVARALSSQEANSPLYVYTVHSPLVMEQEITWRSQGWTGHLKLLLGRGMLAAAERRMLQLAGRIHTLSEYTRTKLDEAYGVGHRIRVIPHWCTRVRTGDGVSKAEARKTLGWPTEARVFFTVRGMGPRYGLDVAIRALAPLLAEHDAYFYLAGDGPMRRELEDLAIGLEGGRGSAARIRFLGRISDDELELAYQAADLFILPTLALECFGLITIEAFAFGCPVLSTDAGAIPESMLPILPRLIVPAGDESALREVSAQVLRGEIALPESRALIDHAMGRYSAAVVTLELLRLLEAPV